MTEALPVPLAPTAVLIKVHAVSLNFRDANISNGGNPWPVTPNGIICNDAAGTVIALGDKVKAFRVGDRVAPIVDTEYITDRSTGRSWLAANEDGVLAEYIVFDENVIAKLPEHLSWETACLIPSAGGTAWTPLRGVGIGKTVVLQGAPSSWMIHGDENMTDADHQVPGGVSCWALEVARAAGLRIILTSSSDTKLEAMRVKVGEPAIDVINYATYPDWHEKVLELTGGLGADLIIDNGGTTTLVKSLKCARRGGIVSQVGYLSKQDPSDLRELVSTIIDRRVNLRYVDLRSCLLWTTRWAAADVAGALMLDRSMTWKTCVPPSPPPALVSMTSLMTCTSSSRRRKRCNGCGRAGLLANWSYACRKIEPGRSMSSIDAIAIINALDIHAVFRDTRSTSSSIYHHAPPPPVTHHILLSLLGGPSLAEGMGGELWLSIAGKDALFVAVDSEDAWARVEVGKVPDLLSLDRL